jgi:hypothetical protein
MIVPSDTPDFAVRTPGLFDGCEVTTYWSQRENRALFPGSHAEHGCAALRPVRIQPALYLRRSRPGAAQGDFTATIRLAVEKVLKKSCRPASGTNAG